MQPKRLPLLVIGINKDTALGDSFLGQLRKALIQKFSSNPLTTMLLGNCKVMRIAAPAIMAAKHSTDDFVALCYRNRAHPGITVEVGYKRLFRIGIVQSHPFW